MGGTREGKAACLVGPRGGSAANGAPTGATTSEGAGLAVGTQRPPLGRVESGGERGRARVLGAGARPEPEPVAP